MKAELFILSVTVFEEASMVPFWSHRGATGLLATLQSLTERQCTHYWERRSREDTVEHSEGGTVPDTMGLSEERSPATHLPGHQRQRSLCLTSRVCKTVRTSVPVSPGTAGCFPKRCVQCLVRVDPRKRFLKPPFLLGCFIAIEEKARRVMVNTEQTCWVVRVKTIY